MSLKPFGRYPAGRAIHCNLLFVTSQKISVAIPNAKTHQQHQARLLENERFFTASDKFKIRLVKFY
jgi:hypothetical protein